MHVGPPGRSTEGRRIANEPGHGERARGEYSIRSVKLQTSTVTVAVDRRRIQA